MSDTNYFGNPSARIAELEALNLSLTAKLVSVKADRDTLAARVKVLEGALQNLVTWHENNRRHPVSCQCGGTTDKGKTWCGQQFQLIATAKQALTPPAQQQEPPHAD